MKLDLFVTGTVQAIYPSPKLPHTSISNTAHRVAAHCFQAVSTQNCSGAHNGVIWSKSQNLKPGLKLSCLAPAPAVNAKWTLTHPRGQRGPTGDFIPVQMRSQNTTKAGKHKGCCKTSHRDSTLLGSGWQWCRTHCFFEQRHAVRNSSSLATGWIAFSPHFMGICKKLSKFNSFRAAWFWTYSGSKKKTKITTTWLRSSLAPGSPGCLRAQLNHASLESFPKLGVRDGANQTSAAHSAMEPWRVSSFQAHCDAWANSHLRLRAVPLVCHSAETDTQQAKLSQEIPASATRRLPAVQDLSQRGRLE